MIIVGGGIIGLSCAWRLSQKGISVTLFEKGELAHEASWAGAGMLAPGGEFEADSPLTQMGLKSRVLYRDFVRELERESGVSIDFRECGGVEVAFDEREEAALSLRAERQSACGIQSEARRYNGSAARFYPADAVVDPRDVTRALAIACRRRGVTIREHERVSELPVDEPVLIAAGAWSSDLLPGFDRVTPVRGHLLGYRMRPGLLGPIVRRGHTYLLQRRSGLVIAGSTTEHAGFDRMVDPERVRDIHRRAAELLPELASRQPDESWIGFRPHIAGGAPLIGQVGETNVWTAIGHYRNGILLAPETARLIEKSVDRYRISHEARPGGSPAAGPKPCPTTNQR